MAALTVVHEKRIVRGLPKNLEIIFLARDVYLAKSSNGEHNVSLRPIDICRIFGKCDRASVTVFGLLLRWLALQGFLIEIRSRKYKPTHKFLEWIATCKWPHCESNGSLCGLIDVCPVHRLQQIIERKEVK